MWSIDVDEMLYPMKELVKVLVLVLTNIEDLRRRELHGRRDFGDFNGWRGRLRFGGVEGG